MPARSGAQPDTTPPPVPGPAAAADAPLGTPIPVPAPRSRSRCLPPLLVDSSAALLGGARVAPAHLSRDHLAAAAAAPAGRGGPPTARNAPPQPKSASDLVPVGAAVAAANAAHALGGVLRAQVDTPDGPAVIHAHNASDAPSPSSSSSPPHTPSSSGSGTRPGPPQRSLPYTDGSEAPPSAADTVRMYNMNAPAARHAPEPQPIPEKCLTWCSQRNDAFAMCRMLCLRRRQPLPTKDEALARLRGRERASASAFGAEGAAPEVGNPQGFFAGLRHRLMPYSLIFIKGTPEGVVGRYMEELEGDDGHYDFGPLSRHAPQSLRKKSTGTVEWFDWGDSGYMLHVPLTSLFAPVVNLPENTERVLGPPLRLLERYQNTFTNGTQERALHRLADEVRSGGALTMLQRMGTHVWTKCGERWEEEREAKARAEGAMAEEAVKRASAGQTGAAQTPVKDKEGGKSE